MSTSLKNGTASELDSGLSPIHMKQATATPAMHEFQQQAAALPEKPLVDRLA